MPISPDVGCKNWIMVLRIDLMQNLSLKIEEKIPTGMKDAIETVFRSSRLVPETAGFPIQAPALPSS